MPAIVEPVGDLLDAYQPIDAWDEMFDADGETRVDYRSLYEHVQTLSKHAVAFERRACDHPPRRVIMRSRAVRFDLMEIG